MIIHRSPGGFSNISQATTAFSSLSAAEADDLDKEIVSLELKPLHDSAEDIIKHIAPMHLQLSNLWDTLMLLRQPGNKYSKLYALKEEAFSLHRKHFGSNEYIRPDIVEKTLYQPKSPAASPSRPRVDELIQKADLAILLTILVGLDRENTVAWNVICRLDRNFPLPFISSFYLSESDAPPVVLMVGSSKLLDESAALGISIRTQLTIMHFAKAAERGRFDPEEELLKIWFEPADSNSDEATIRGWETNTLGGEGSRLSKKHERAVQTRLDDIREFFTQDAQSADSEDVDLEQLSSFFPWQDFVVEALVWIRRRNHEISRAITGRGGVDEILRNLEKEIGETQDPESQTPERALASRSITPRSALKSSAKKSPAQARYVSNEYVLSTEANDNYSTWNDSYRANWKDLAAYQRRVSGVQPAPATAPATVDEGYGPIFVDEQVEDVPAGPSVPENVDRLTQLQIQDRRNKQILERSQPAATSERNPFVEEQTNEERVERSDSTQARSQALPRTSQPRSPVLPRTSQLSQGKRPAQVFDEDEDDDDQQVTQDEGFEQDLREASNARRQAAPPTKRLRIEEPAPAPRASASTAAAPRAQLDSDDEALFVSGAPSASYTYRAVNALAKDYARLAAPRTQARVRWTAAEEDALLAYIRAAGCSWARIKRLDAGGDRALDARDQVALKDKARNMKFDFLRAGVELPENFAAVALNASQKKRLMDMGIEDF